MNKVIAIDNECRTEYFPLCQYACSIKFVDGEKTLITFTSIAGIHHTRFVKGHIDAVSELLNTFLLKSEKIIWLGFVQE